MLSEERYEIIKLLGKGRIGGVYEGEDKNLQRKVAVRRFFDQEGNTDLIDHKDGFIEVAQSLSNLQHPNLLRVYDAGVDEDGAYIVSQLLEGKVLHEEIKEGQMEVTDVMELARQMLDAFSQAHDTGHHHGALTADSVLMVPQARGGYRYVILDMGLSGLAPLIKGENAVLTKMADRAILAPELFDGEVTNVRADLYMLGHILYMCLAGGHPFASLSVDDVKARHLEGLPPITDYNDDVPEEIIHWLSSFISVKPEDRPASAMEALDSLIEIPPEILQYTKLKPQAASLSPRDASLEAKPLNFGTRIGQTVTQVSDTTAGNNLTRSPAAQQANINVASAQVQPGATMYVKTGKRGSPVGVFIGIGVVLVAAVVIAFLMSGEEKQASPKEVNGTDVPRGRLSDEISVRDGEEDVVAPVVEKENLRGVALAAGVIAEFDGSATDHNDWEYLVRDTQSKVEQGWSIYDDKATTYVGIKHSLSKEDAQEMYEKGWRITYSAYIKRSSQRLGFFLDSEHNPGWGDGGSVGCNLVIVLEKGSKMRLFLPQEPRFKDNSESITIRTKWMNSNNLPLNLVIEQAPASDEYTVWVNGKERMRGRLNKNIDFKERSRTENSFANSSVGDQSNPIWILRTFKLETL